MWAGFLLESPAYVDGSAYEDVDKIFDWSATYRRDSDIYVPYGKFYRVNTAPSVSLLESMQDSLRWAIEFLILQRSFFDVGI